MQVVSVKSSCQRVVMVNGKVYGSGMLAQSFQNGVVPDGIVVVAAGVSNSLETRESEFSREKDMLTRIIAAHPKDTLVYFSSCSVYQASQSPYVQHKLAMEKLIEECCSSYCICRLPQVVGITNNTTIVSYFSQCIVDESVIAVQQNAARSLIGVEDVVRVVKRLVLSESALNSVVDISSGRSISVLELVNMISDVIKIKPSVRIVEGGESYSIPSQKLREFLAGDDLIFTKEYFAQLLAHYVPLIAMKCRQKL